MTTATAPAPAAPARLCLGGPRDGQWHAEAPEAPRGRYAPRETAHGLRWLWIADLTPTPEVPRG